jgi:chromosome segregation ATPase
MTDRMTPERLAEIRKAGVYSGAFRELCDHIDALEGALANANALGEAATEQLIAAKRQNGDLANRWAAERDEWHSQMAAIRLDQERVLAERNALVAQLTANSKRHAREIDELAGQVVALTADLERGNAAIGDALDEAGKAWGQVAALRETLSETVLNGRWYNKVRQEWLQGNLELILVAVNHVLADTAEAAQAYERRVTDAS